MSEAIYCAYFFGTGSGLLVRLDSFGGPELDRTFLIQANTSRFGDNGFGFNIVTRKVICQPAQIFAQHLFILIAIRAFADLSLPSSGAREIYLALQE